MPTTRQRRVSELIREEVSLILQQEVSAPHVGFATVTDLEISADLREAQVFVSVFGQQEQREEGIRALQHAAGYVRSLLAKRVELRVVPELFFHLDDTPGRASRVMDLLHQVEDEIKGKEAE